MSSSTHDRILWIAVAIGLCTAYVVIPRTLNHVYKITELPPPKPQPVKKTDQDAEDEIKLSTLKTLADSPNYGLRSTVIKIISERALEPVTRRALLADLSSTDSDTRDQAINALWLLLYHPSVKKDAAMHAFAQHASLCAIIDALVNILPLYRTGDGPPSSPVKPFYRPPHDRSLILILHLVLLQLRDDGRLMPALRAGIVSRWLCKYPFPCADPANAHMGFEKSQIYMIFAKNKWADDDLLMSEIFTILMRDTQGAKELRLYGLNGSKYDADITLNSREPQDEDSWVARRRPSSYRRPTDLDVLYDEPDQDVPMANGSSTAGRSPLRRTSTADSDANRPTSSWAEYLPFSRIADFRRISLRRRHREAVVVAAPGEPLSRENILQRSNSRTAPAPLPPGQSTDRGLEELRLASNSDSSPTTRPNDLLSSLRAAAPDLPAASTSAIEAHYFWRPLPPVDAGRGQTNSTAAMNEAERLAAMLSDAQGNPAALLEMLLSSGSLYTLPGFDPEQARAAEGAPDAAAAAAAAAAVGPPHRLTRPPMPAAAEDSDNLPAEADPPPTPVSTASVAELEAVRARNASWAERAYAIREARRHAAETETDTQTESLVGVGVETEAEAEASADGDAIVTIQDAQGEESSADLQVADRIIAELEDAGDGIGGGSGGDQRRQSDHTDVKRDDDSRNEVDAGSASAAEAQADGPAEVLSPSNERLVGINEQLPAEERLDEET